MREVRVMVARMPTMLPKAKVDILGRVLSNRDDEEDCIRAETSQIMEEEEVKQRVQSRRAELALSCGAPLRVVGPDLTSTPRTEHGNLSEQTGAGAPPTRGRSRTRRPRPLGKRPASLEEEDEILRSSGTQAFAEDWNVSLETEANFEDAETTGPYPDRNNKHRCRGNQCPGVKSQGKYLQSSRTRTESGPGLDPQRGGTPTR